MPAGGALAVDREAYSGGVEAALVNHPNITLRREEVTHIPDEPCIIACGPLTSTALAEDIARLTGEEYLYFYDAIAPVHVSGHASQEEQKLLINLVKPKHFLPIHGELRQLKRHALSRMECFAVFLEFGNGTSEWMTEIGNVFLRKAN